MDALSLGSLYALAALGLGLIFSILRLINFAHGDFITIGAYALIVPSTSATAAFFIGGWSWYALVPAVCLIVAAFALLADGLVFRWLREATPTTLLTASFGVSYFIQNSVLLIYGALPKAIDLWPVLNSQLSVSGLRIPLVQIVTIVVTFILVGGLTLFLKLTSVGIQMRAAASDFKMARYLGVRADRVIALAFALSGALAAIVSLLFATQTGSLSFNMGVPIALFAFVAVVVGGLGSLLGSVLGGFAVGITMTLLQALLPPSLRPFRDAFAFGLILLLLIYRPSGLIRTSALVDRV
ncbi:MAG TPA: branched-chain amino acid ABC transporter permease [Xanthobacteraceae bacterium]|nr:branched-chain amino acid ABC transporter permease [Xanthobacteraceae bacterium]